jgi:hypothetical protein
MTGGQSTQMVRIGAPAAPGTTNIVAAIAGNNVATNLTIAGQPDVPRNLRAVFATSYDGGNIVATGIDQFDDPVTETLVAVPNSTVVGTKVFKRVNTVTKGVGANAATVSVGTGSKLGIPVILANAFGILTANGVAEANTVDAVEEAVTPTTAPNGSVVFVFLGNV